MFEIGKSKTDTGAGNGGIERMPSLNFPSDLTVILPTFFRPLRQTKEFPLAYQARIFATITCFWTSRDRAVIATTDAIAERVRKIRRDDPAFDAHARRQRQSSTNEHRDGRLPRTSRGTSATILRN